MRSRLKEEKHKFAVNYRYELHRGKSELGEVALAGKEHFSRTLDFNKFDRNAQADLPQIGIIVQAYSYYLNYTYIICVTV